MLPQPLRTLTRAGPSKRPSLVDVDAGPPRPPQSRAQLGATAKAAPTTRPGTAAATRTSGRLTRVRRNTRLRPIATSASGQNRRTSDRLFAGTAPRSFATRTAPTATRKTPQLRSRRWTRIADQDLHGDGTLAGRWARRALVTSLTLGSARGGAQPVIRRIRGGASPTRARRLAGLPRSGPGR